jgi:aromatic ring hydroxylase
LITSFNTTMQDVTWLVFVKTFLTRITSVFFLVQHYHRIEHLWDELGRRVRHRQNPPETPQELCDALVHEWNNILQAFIQRLIDYMRRICAAVVAARGGLIRYWIPLNSILHENFYLSRICSDNDVDIALFAMPILI